MQGHKQPFSLSKRPAQAFRLGQRNDTCTRISYNRRMAGSRYNWYLAEWLDEMRIKQSFVAKELEWNKAKVSLTAAGKQPYSRDDLSAVADLFNLEPYELLMHPRDAMALRQLRAMAEQIASAGYPTDPDDTPPPPQDEFHDVKFKREEREERRRTGTHG